MAFKYYVVAHGRHPGIYPTWAACQQEVHNFPQARFKGFNDLTAAQIWLKNPVWSVEKKSVLTQSQTGNDLQNAEIRIWTDGGSRNHGNRLNQHVKADDVAAWAYLIKFAHQQYADSAGEFGATNNRMEIMALYQALSFLLKQNWQQKSIVATLDSRYVLNAITQHWLNNWQKRGWKTVAGQPVANQELWQKLAKILAKFPQLHFSWTKGHADEQGNVFVDHLLNQTMDQMKVKQD
ncbi:ribonuclease H family protein [Liquorilactobacillus sicerae]|uniref:ribonuclease H family protein n=1 Tax=Liquorilactobacillus sicerae TaxID=1416943 RepID=UPI00247FD0A9